MFSSKPMKVLPIFAGVAFAVGLIGQASALPMDSSLRKAASEASPMVQDVRYVAKKKHTVKRKKVVRRHVRHGRRGYGPAAAFGAVAAGIGAAIAADRYNDGYYGSGYYGYGYGPGYYGNNYGYPPPVYYGPRYRHRYGYRPVYPRPNPVYPGPIYSGRPLGQPTTAVVPHYRGPIGGGGFGGGGVVRPAPGFGGGGLGGGRVGGGGGFVGGGGGGGGAVTAPVTRGLGQ